MRIDSFVVCAAVKIGLAAGTTVTSAAAAVKIGSSVGTAVTSAGTAVKMRPLLEAVASFAVHPASLAVRPASFAARSAYLICLKYF